MDRFAQSSFIKNIGVHRKLDDTVCRCCGVSYDETYPIIDQVAYDGIEFKEKLEKLTDIKVEATDKMPQRLCIVCLDKINDFFEFRLMAQNTEKTTREALGLPQPLGPKKASLLPKVSLLDLKYAAKDKLLLERALHRLKEEQPATSKKRSERTVAPVAQPPIKKSKKEISCSICKDTHFAYNDDLNDHLSTNHLPTNAKYACGSCRETFQQLSDFKAHESMHLKEKIPYTCFICCSEYARLRDFVKHTTNYNCLQKEKLEVTVEDIKCFQCKKKFLTQNLFEWHGCFLKTRGNCSKCGKYYPKKQTLFKHYVLCSGKFKAPEGSVKTEGANVKAPVKLTGKKQLKSAKAAPTRKMSTLPIVKSELNIGPPPDEAEDNYDITYDTFPNDSDSDEGPSGSALVPEVNLQEAPPISVKQEKIIEMATIQVHKNLPISSDQNQMIRNIKKEKAAAVTIGCRSIPNASPGLRLKIKTERESTAAVTQYLNPMALKQKPGPKRFKIPRMLAMKIKQEKKDIGYGDQEERDEAEPEDEDLLSGYHDDALILKIKKEKMDPAYCDKVKKKQLINPVALAGLREKTAINGEIQNKFLVISAVTSINPDTSVGDDTPMTDNDFTVSTEKPETSDVSLEETPAAAESTAMIQIPSSNLEFNANHNCHSSESINTCDESSQAKKAEPILENTTSLADNPDDLDALLKKYENSDAPVDNNIDLLQELLKLD